MAAETDTFEKLKQSASIPRLPQVMLRLIQAFDDDGITIDGLTTIIAADPTLASRLMEIIGSAAINLPREINSIETAVVYLGMDTIRNIAISTCALHVFNTAPKIDGFNLNLYWSHSYTCAVTAKKLASEMAFPHPDEAFLAGLLHDIGRLVLITHFPDTYTDLLSRDLDDREFLALETQSLGTSSADVSAWLFRHWRLNSLTADAVQYISEPVSRIATALTLVKIVFLAHQITETGVQDLPGDVIALTDISRSRLEDLARDAAIDVAGMAETLGIKVFPAADQAQQEISNALYEDSLALRMHDFSLFFGTLQNLFAAETIPAIIDTTDNGLKIVFTIPRIFYFLYDEERSLLTGFSSTADKHARIISSIAVPWSNTTSILTRSLSGNTIINSLNDDGVPTPPISDTQISRLLEGDGMYCIPMRVQKRPIGVIVMGIQRHQVKPLVESNALLTLFARQTAMCIQNVRYRNEYSLIIQNERMQAYSTITRKIIHEVNNPIVIITNYLKMLSLKLPDKHPVQSELGVISEEIDRIAGLIRKLSGFSKPMVSEFKPVDINQLYTSVLDIISKSILLPRGIRTHIHTDPRIPVIKTDRDGLKQVLINLLKNASEAMESGGEIIITTRFIPESVKILIDERKKVPGSIEITVSDNGPGIPAAIREHLFEPYNSSKSGDNSGLGLSIVHAIIKILNGTISCQSVEGKGTTFTIGLPVSSTRRDQAALP
ncbi:MAG: HDOD domain-containing protein [Pseudomonadota bacterium]